LRTATLVAWLIACRKRHKATAQAGLATFCHFEPDPLPGCRARLPELRHEDGKTGLY
jgi:hypothetical protein